MNRATRIVFLLWLLAGGLWAQDGWIRINQAGYTPESIKVAVLGSKQPIKADTFEVIDVLTDRGVFKHSPGFDRGPYACFEHTRRLDFTLFRGQGTFVIRCGSVVSPRFTISDDIYNGAADFLLNYMRQQRCGYNPFLKDSCHTHDGFIVDHPTLDSTHIDVTGGWHDASDYLQYVATSANAIYQMLLAWEHFPHAFGDHYQANGDPASNGIPDILDEAKWGLDWLDKMNPDSAMMFNQIADDRDHRKFTLPTLDSIRYGKGWERPVYFVTGKKQGLAVYKNRTTGVSSTAGKFASAFALGAELLQDYYPDFCQRIAGKAVDAFEFGKSDLGVCQTASNLAPYFYEEQNYVDDLELAAAQLYKLENDPVYLDQAMIWGDIEPVTPWMGADSARHYQWYPFINVGHYRIAQWAEPKLKGKFIYYLRQGIQRIEQKGRANGFYMGVPFIWCSNNLVTALLTQIQLYETLTRDRQFAELKAAMCDWLLGCNPWGTSMIVGYPEHGDTPVDPHSAFTAVFGYAIDGGLVDGPVYTSIFDRLIGLTLHEKDEYAEFQSDLCVYHDDYGDYSTNEPTMDGTACLIPFFASLAVPERPGKETMHWRYGALERGDTDQKIIHLIFSGGDHSEGGETIVQTLRKQEVKAHFFFTGDFYRHPKNRQLIPTLKQDGHYLGAHSDKHLLYADWEHRDSLLVSKEEFIRDLANNYKAMQAFDIEKEKAPLFLPPYEWYNQTISKWTKELGLTLINFTPGTYSNADYTTPEMGNQYWSSDRIYERILHIESESEHGLNGFLLLMHIGTVDERPDKFYHRLDELISELKSRGYRFELLLDVYPDL